MGGGGTHPGFGYPLQNGPRELWLSTQSKLEKRVSVIDSEKGAVRGAYSVGAVVLDLSSPRTPSWISYNKCFDYVQQ